MRSTVHDGKTNMQSRRRIADTIAGLRNAPTDTSHHFPRNVITNSAIAMDDYFNTQKQPEMCSHFIPVRNDSARPCVFALSHVDTSYSASIFPASLMLEPGESGRFEALMEVSKTQEFDFVLRDVTSLREFKFTYTNQVVDDEEGHDSSKRLLCSDACIQLDNKMRSRKFRIKNAHHTFCVLTARVLSEYPHVEMFKISINRKRLASGDEVEGIVESISGETSSSSSCVITITAKFMDSRKPHRFHLKVYCNN